MDSKDDPDVDNPGGLGMAAANRHSIAFPLTLVVIGGVLLLKELGYLHGNVLRYWPVLLIVWGLGMIWAARNG